MHTVTETQGAQRGDLPEGGETIEMWGSKYVWDSVLEDLRKLDKRRLSSIRKTIRKITMQVDVDIDCTETFFVSDDRTQEVCCCRVQRDCVVGIVPS